MKFPPSKSFDLYATIAILIFVAHIVLNFVVVRNPSGTPRFEKLTLFPPLWVFSIWLVIWWLHGTLLYKSYGTGFWTAPLTLLFVLICVGNIGSQWAGATGKSWVVYIAFLGTMFLSAFLFMKRAEGSTIHLPVIKPASQLYVGWASVAMVVGIGVITVAHLQVVKDSVYTILGVSVLVALPILIWTLWYINGTDYRVVSAPYLLVLFALALRLLIR